MKKIITTILLAMLTLTAFAQQNRAEWLRTKLFDRNSNYIFVVSHRGDWRNAPENSLQAMKNCIDMGVDIVEIDLKITKDSVLILMHDKTIDRTTTGKGKPADYTFEELQKFNLRNGAGHATAHKIPRFEDVMLLCKDKILVNVDKGYNYFKQVYKIIEKTGTIRQTIIKSDYSYNRVNSENGDILNKVIFMPVVNIEKDNAAEKIADYQTHISPVAFELVYANETPKTLAIIEQVRNNSQVWINTLWPSLCGGRDDDRAVEQNEKDETWGWMINHGIKILQTDRPALLIKYLKRNN